MLRQGAAAILNEAAQNDSRAPIHDQVRLTNAPHLYLMRNRPRRHGPHQRRGLVTTAADVVITTASCIRGCSGHTTQDAEKIEVGLAAPQPLTISKAINYLLVEKAREGKIVARLKWGDPFVFDRAARKRCSFTSTACRSKWARHSGRASARNATRASRSHIQAAATADVRPRARG